MLFGLSVAPLHSDLWDLCCMPHTNTAAAFKAPSFLFWVCCSLTVSTKVQSACSGVYLYILSAQGWRQHTVCMCVCLGLVVDVLAACGDCCQCCAVGWLCSRSKAWSTPARDYKELPTCTHTHTHSSARCMLIGGEEAWEQFCEQLPLVLKYCLVPF